MTTRFNYRDTLIKSFFDRYSKEDRHELYNLIKVYRLYKSEDVNILLATHAGLIDDITENGQPPMGSLTLHCENDEILNLPINYKI